MEAPTHYVTNTMLGGSGYAHCLCKNLAEIYLQNKWVAAAAACPSLRKLAALTGGFSMKLELNGLDPSGLTPIRILQAVQHSYSLEWTVTDLVQWNSGPYSDAKRHSFSFSYARRRVPEGFGHWCSKQVRARRPSAADVPSLLKALKRDPFLHSMLWPGALLCVHSLCKKVLRIPQSSALNLTPAQVCSCSGWFRPGAHLAADGHLVSCMCTRMQA